MIQGLLPPPSNETLILVCGPPKMVEHQRANLAKLKFTDEMIFAF